MLKSFSWIQAAPIALGIVVFSLVYVLASGSSTSSGSKETTQRKGYYDYDAETVAKDDNDIVLFFHADWCHSCVTIDKDIKKQGVTPGVSIYKVNFDREKELRKKYQILTQTSFAHIKADGTLVKRWVGGFGIDDIMKQLHDSSPKLWQERRKKNNLSHLNKLQYEVTQNKGTEPPFNNKYRDHKETGIYVDIVDGTPLFSSLDKFDSGTGWPSFSKPINQTKVDSETDLSHGMARTEIISDSSEAHLGHIFNDGPKETGGQRYCINSAALDFIPLEKMEELGYGEYLSLFE